MDFEQALEAELKVISGLMAKVFPIEAPLHTKPPYATYESSGLAKLKTFDGHEESGTLECTVDVLEATYAKMKTLGGLVKTKIESFQGRTIGTDGPDIQNVTFEDLLPETYEPNVELYKKSIIFTVFF